MASVLGQVSEPPATIGKPPGGYGPVSLMISRSSSSQWKNQWEELLQTTFFLRKAICLQKFKPKRCTLHCPIEIWQITFVI